MTSVSISQFINQSGVAFGTSGARGLVVDMTDRVCVAYILAFLQHSQAQGEFSAGTQVALAGDLRPSTPRILSACVAAVRAAGGEPLFCGYTPTPTLALFAFGRQIPSLMVTGSHIPDDRNGIKFNRPTGELLKPDEAAMRQMSVGLGDLNFDAAGALIDSPSLAQPLDIREAFTARYLDIWGAQALAGMRIGVYEHSSVGRDLLADLMEKLGADVLRLGRSERFVPVDTEAIRPTDHDLARKWATEFHLDAIVSTDGDADRPLLADEKGLWLRGDILGLLCARFVGSRTAVTPVSSNTALERSGWFTHTHRTRIGSPYVIDAMLAAKARGEHHVCGYEANGGFLLADDHAVNGKRLAALPTRDAFLPLVAVLAQARARACPVSSLLIQLPGRFTHSDRIQDCPTSATQAWLERVRGNSELDLLQRLTSTFSGLCGDAAAVDETDGMRVTFANREVLHFRPSGNAPELRCYAEAESADRAHAINEAALALIKSELRA